MTVNCWLTEEGRGWKAVKELDGSRFVLKKAYKVLDKTAL
jgi:hypothetical protein